MRHVVVALDVVKIHSLGYSVVLIQVAQIRPEVSVIDDAAEIALEVAMIDRVEPDERREKAPVGFGQASA